MNRLIAPIACLSFLVACDRSPTEEASIEETPSAGAPSVILIIGDGLDDHQITIARNYLVGQDGRLTIDGMPYRGMVQVQTVSDSDPSVPMYVGDSASGASAMATGRPTAEGRLSTAAKTNERLTTVMEMAQSAGVRTGIVVTSRVTDATPSSFIAHMSNRYCETSAAMVREDTAMPQDSTDCSAEYKANGGPGSVVEQIAVSEVDVLLGGGRGRFESYEEGSETRTARDLAIASGFSIVEDAAALKSFDGTGKLLGLFGNGHLPERMRGGLAEFIERKDGVPQLPEPFSCEPNPEFGDTPSLAEMTRVALDRLDNESGFMLMVESASIDKAAHYWRPCGSIGEMEQLDETVAVALAFAAENPETLVLVASDHGQSAQLFPPVSDLAPQNFAPVGRFARLRTPEGGIMGVSYATNDSPHWEDHTGVQVPLYASGPGADKLPQYLLQSDIFHITATHLGLSDSWPEK